LRATKGLGDPIIVLNGIATIITFAVAQAYVIGLLLFLISLAATPISPAGLGRDSDEFSH